MASTTVITAVITPSDAVAHLSTGSTSAALTSASSAALAGPSSFDPSNKGIHSSMQPPPQMQSQTSSQQSFAMSQPSSQQNAGNGSIYRQYSEPARHANEGAQNLMPIYSVPFSPSSHAMHPREPVLTGSNRPRIPESTCTRWRSTELP